MCDNNTSCIFPTTGAAPNTFAGALYFFAATQCLQSNNPLPDDSVQDGATYDFIIVGGGSAGCVLANRLSEVKTWKVLLIEAGSSPPVENNIPSMSGNLFGSEYDWQYYTEDNGVTNKASVDNNVYWPRGKMLGGSSSMNNMIYMRGNHFDYESWDVAGNKDWSVDVVKNCFEKAENLQDLNLARNQSIRNFYGKKGPLVVNTFNSTYRPLTRNVLKSWDEIGIKTVEDLNYANALGSGIFRATAFDGHRGSTNDVYLIPARVRHNLHVITNALVTKVIIDQNTRQANGVKVEYEGNTMNLFSSKEVILSAGAINTPQLLMLSGIGPKKHLNLKNIHCLVDLPAVGKYLQDHFLIPVTIFGDEPEDPTEVEKSFGAIQYLFNKTGPLAYSNIPDITAFYARHKEALYPEFQNHILLFGKNSPGLKNYLSSVPRYREPVRESLINQNKNSSLYLFAFNLLHPYSTGYIYLNSSDPKNHPQIYANYLSDPRDLKAAVDGIKMLTKIVHTKYFRSINARLGRIGWPECDGFELDSDEYWECIAINMVITIYHPVGTARMGTDVETSVVSSDLKVHGIEKLRVIDASVMISLISGNTNGPVIMIGERGANLIKRDYGIKDPNDMC